MVSALHFSGSVPDKAVKMALANGRLAFCNSTISELKSVLNREKFEKYDPERKRIANADTLIKSGLIFNIDNVTTNLKSRDNDDNIFLLLALSSDASCLISGDEDLLILNEINNIPILKAADFMNHLNLLLKP